MTEETAQYLIDRKAYPAPRVTPEDVEAEIDCVYYFTANEGVYGANMSAVAQVMQPTAPALGLLTSCVIVLRNGFTVTGESACASPENFDAEIGRRLAREAAVRKIWPLLGFRLRDQLAQRENPPAPSSPKPDDFKFEVRQMVYYHGCELGRPGTILIRSWPLGLNEQRRYLVREFDSDSETDGRTFLEDELRAF